MFFGALYCVSIAASTALPEPIDQALKKQQLPSDSISIFVEETETHKPVLDWRSTEQLNPASTMKIITTYAGLDLLGKDYQWNTKFFVDSPIIGGHLREPLYIKGYGDPYLINETLEQAIIAIREQGLHTLSGGLVIDNSYFQLEQKLALTDDSPLSAYNAIPDAANINFGTVEFNILTGRYSSRPNVEMNPPLPGYKVFSRMRLRGGKCSSKYYKPKIDLVPYKGNTTINFAGNYSKRCGNSSLYRVVASADKILYGAFKKIWQQHGGKLSGGYKYGVVPESAKLVHTHVSEPLLDQIAIMNKKSNNVMTRQLFLTIGAEKVSAPGTLEKSRRVINNWLHKKDIQTDNSFFDNGSGLSRKSTLSTKLLAEILTDAAEHPLATEFAQSLAIAGVDGTMKSRFRQHPAKGKLFLKTGTLTGVRAIAGYVNSQSGKQYTVAMIQVHPNTSNGKGKAVQNAVLDWLYHHEN